MDKEVFPRAWTKRLMQAKLAPFEDCESIPRASNKEGEERREKRKRGLWIH